MIQIWIESESSTKLAHFDANGVARFATIEGDYGPASARSALLASTDIRTDILPDPGKPILWHGTDKPTIVAFYQSLIDEAQGEFLAKVVTRNHNRIVVYILKRLEILSMAFDVGKLFDTPILNAESGGGASEKSSLKSEWTTKGNAWLAAVGATEAAAKTAKESIANASDDKAMAAIVAAFPAALSEALS